MPLDGSPRRSSRATYGRWARESTLYGWTSNKVVEMCRVSRLRVFMRGVAAVTAGAVLVVALSAAVPVRQSSASSSQGRVTTTFEVNPLMTAQVRDGAVVVVANIPWTVSVSWADADCDTEPYSSCVSGGATGAPGRHMGPDSVGDRPTAFTLVTGR